MTLHRETLAVTSGRPTGAGDPLNAPLVMSSTYRAGGPLTYGRDGNAGWQAFEAAIGAMEGGDAVAFSSGLAAVAAVLATVPAGGVVVAPLIQYHGVTQQLAELAVRSGMEVRTIDLTDRVASERVLDGANLVWAESPSNPVLDIVDLRWLVDVTRATKTVLAVDSTLATPLLQQPLQLGADVVVHSATKFIGGHSDLLLGVVATTRDDLLNQMVDHRYVQGAVPGVLEIFLALRGLRTLPVRMQRAQSTAAALSRQLQNHEAVSRVSYPGLSDHRQHDLATRQMSGFGAMVSFETIGSADHAERLCEALELIVHGTSLGGVETLIERRARHAGDRDAGVPETLLRMSVGLEHEVELWADLKQALDLLDK